MRLVIRFLSPPQVGALTRVKHKKNSVKTKVCPYLNVMKMEPKYQLNCGMLKNTQNVLQNLQKHLEIFTKTTKKHEGRDIMKKVDEIVLNLKHAMLNTYNGTMKEDMSFWT
eukprot:UN12945